MASKEDAQSRRLTDQQINLTAWAARDGTADHTTVREMMDMFYQLALDNRPVPPGLIRFVAESFGRYLGRKDFYGADERSVDTLDSAFGLVRKRGRPESDEQLQLEMASTVLRRRLLGMSHQDAIAEASSKFGWGQTQVSKAWRVYRELAVHFVRNERPTHTNPWSPDEQRALKRF